MQPTPSSMSGTVAPSVLHVGLDVGSTTVKSVVLDPRDGTVLYRSYRRHGARQAQTTAQTLADIAEKFAGSQLRVALCGSGGQEIADTLGIPFIQEVVANALAVRTLHPTARCAIELGGQDAKMIFFKPSSDGHGLEVADMRMNGVCAGGTGAFVDEMAALLHVPSEEFDDLAAQGRTVFDVSGRCGVYAKTDVQPLLNQGVSRADIALSVLHAVAKQTIGGLAQGLDIEAPVIFEGGVLTYNPTLVRVFEERLNLASDQSIVPAHPQTIVAHGAALSLGAGELFAGAPALNDPAAAIEQLEKLGSDTRHEDGAAAGPSNPSPTARPFFATPEEQAAFEARHPKSPAAPGAQATAQRLGASPQNPQVLRVYLGIDSGSTTTKFALLDEDEQVLDSFYSPNRGEPLKVAQAALVAMRDRWRAAGIELEVVAVGTTGYGEMLFARALHADFHTVETVAHARTATKAEPEATFVLDIGGQDMKAIWLDHGVLTDIVVNEACSSGCGSFLETFAASLGIEVRDIAAAAFSSREPAELGSRCTVFMTSSIVSEQRLGKTPQDIMAGLCRSIVQNVFTKVVRVANLDRLGNRVVVQGGTFENDAVLCALEQYLGRDVTRVPHPGLSGAVGAALLAREDAEHRAAAAGEAAGVKSQFIGFDALETLTYEQHANVACERCANHCNLTLVSFSDGTTWVTGNRCERGAQVDPAKPLKAPSDENASSTSAAATAHNLYNDRTELLFAKYPYTQLAPDRGITIGLPRVLALWDSAPFWTTFFRALGFTVKLSRTSTRAMFERGLAAVPSDTVCFPAKLVHGHVRNLVDAHVDRIFMPAVSTIPSENRAETSESMCAVVKGYPLVMQNSDNPERRWGVPFDAPLFHWHAIKDRDEQLKAYMLKTFNIAGDLVAQAITQADAAQGSFATQLEQRGAQLLDEVRACGGYAVVLAGRPYHNDPLVNHDLPRMFCEQGISVLPVDAVPGVRDVDLSASRLDIVNNYHARMLSGAVLAARDQNLEYAQVVSFGCGHDAYLSDEIVRLMRETSGKAPLILKVDESDNAGPLRIRVRSFVESVNTRRELQESHEVNELPDPYAVKYTKPHRRGKVVLVPNTSHAFCLLMTSVLRKQGIRAEPLPIGRERAIELGKRYVHNDICFPAQITIGEALEALESGRYDDADVAVVTGKYIGDCRLTHYAPLLRKALDDAGYAHVPVLTNDDVDERNIHPGFRLSLDSAINIAFGLPMIDVLEELLRKIRPYELEPGSTNQAFDQGLDLMMEGVEKGGVRGIRAGFKRAIELMKEVRYDRSHPRERVLIVGEYLLNFHPGANHDIEDYLERNGLEVVEARMTDVIRKTYFNKAAQVRDYGVTLPFKQRVWNATADKLFDLAHNACDRIAVAHPLYEPAVRLPDLAKESDQVLHHTFDAGEGILIPGEILHNMAHGVRSFVILQPFGCLPNHVCGRGIVKRLRELCPDAQILSLDFDPDASFANIENRLQMLVMNARARAEAIAKPASGAAAGASC